MHNTHSVSGSVLILGGTGKVGLEAARYLLNATDSKVRLASRSAAALPADLQQYRARVEMLKLDIEDEQALRATIQQSRLVISCVGPSGIVGATVALACNALQVPLVDAGGYDPVLQQLSGLAQQGLLNVPLVISVGLLPGLSGMLPKYLLDQAAQGRRVKKLFSYCIGRDAWTYNSAWDIVHSMGDFGQDRGFPVIKHGRHQAVGLRQAMSDAEFPSPIGKVKTMLVPAEELARLARQHQIAEARAYGSNVGKRAAMVCMLAKIFKMYNSHKRIVRAARWLVKGSAKDMLGAEPVYALRVELEFEDGSQSQQSLVIHNTYPATGIIIGITAEYLLAPTQALPAQVYMLHEALPSNWFFERLLATNSISLGSIQHDIVEEITS